MAGILTQPHLQRLESLRRVRWVLQGEPGSISLLKRDSTKALVEFLSVDRGVAPFNEDPDGNRLPPGVQLELQVAEELISREDYDQAAAIQHGEQLYRILNPQAEAEEFRPSGLRRFWRFWLAPLEEVL